MQEITVAELIDTLTEIAKEYHPGLSVCIGYDREAYGDGNPLLHLSEKIELSENGTLFLQIAGNWKPDNRPEDVEEFVIGE